MLRCYLKVTSYGWAAQSDEGSFLLVLVSIALLTTLLVGWVNPESLLRVVIRRGILAETSHRKHLRHWAVRLLVGQSSGDRAPDISVMVLEVMHDRGSLRLDVPSYPFQSQDPTF